MKKNTFRRLCLSNILSTCSFLKSFVIMVTMMFMITSNALAEVIDGFNYLLDYEARTAMLLPNTMNKYSGDIIVPEKIKDFEGKEYQVTAFFQSCFLDCSGMTSITIPSTVTALGGFCFAGCTSLTTITIPSSVTYIGTSCFQDCTNLTSITIPSSVTNISTSCFKNCSRLSSIIIPSSVSSLDGICFAGCSSLTSITIPSTVMSLGVSCFTDCTNLETVFFKGKLPRLYFMSMESNDYCSLDIPSNCIINVPAEYLQDYKEAFGPDYKYIYAWNPEDSGGQESGIDFVKTYNIVASAHDGIIRISGLDNGEVVKFYSADGKLIGLSSAVCGVASCTISGTMVIAKIGKKSIKVAVK